MENSLGVALKKANNALARDRDHFAKSLGLTGMQVSVINYIADHETTQDIFQRDLEHEFNIRKATASALVTTMVTKDLLVRVLATTDARYKRLILTPTARQTAKQVGAFFNTSEQRMQTLLAENFGLTYQSLQAISAAFNATNTPFNHDESNE